MTDEELKQLEAMCDAAPEMSDRQRASFEKVLQSAAEREAHGQVGVVSMDLVTARELFALATAAQQTSLRSAIDELLRMRASWDQLKAQGHQLAGEAVQLRDERNRLCADNDRLRALVDGAERAGGLSGHTPPYVLGCPWCLSAPNEFGLRHSLNCPAFTPDGQVR